MTLFEIYQDDRFLTNIEIRPAGWTIRKEIDMSSSYINNKVEHPQIGKGMFFKDIVFEDVDLNTLKDEQWKFINPDEEIKKDIYMLQEIWCEPVWILRL